MSDRQLLWLYGAVVVVVQLGLVAGVWLPVPHTGGDNAAYVALADALLSGEGYTEMWTPGAPPHTKYPPVFPALLAVAVAFGARSWTALKLVPALFAVAAGALTYLWVARRRTPAVGAAVAILFALSPALLWYSHWVLSDVPFVAFTLLALLAFDRWEGERGGWLLVATGATVLAYMTRSAGLPLLVAGVGWLAFRRRWRALGIFGGSTGLVALLWWLRGRGQGARYVGEFWMVDPYQPELGTVGFGGLVRRVVENAGGYLTQHLPAGMVGGAEGLPLLVALAVVGLGIAGWASALRRRPRVAEVFVPLYAGLILLWPEVWSGDRFALPLVPLLLFYATGATEALVRRVAPKAEWASGVAVGVLAVVVALPALGAWTETSEQARACRDRVARAPAPYACQAAPWSEFVEAARWSGANLAADAVVLTRKPRIFYTMGGTASVTYPFSGDPGIFFVEAERVGARYVLLDLVGRQAYTYVASVVQARIASFCSAGLFSPSGASLETHLLGILDDPAAGAGNRIVRTEEGGRLDLVDCPPDLVPRPLRETPPTRGLDVPLLAESRSP